MKPAGLIPSLQSDALAREIEQQLKEETAAVIATAGRDAGEVLAQARTAARARMHDSIAELRREGERRLSRARAQQETEIRAQMQRRAARAVEEAMPLLSEALAERWREVESRRQWTDGVAKLCLARLQRSTWTIAHPADWPAEEQRRFAQSVGADGLEVAFEAAKELDAGLKVTAGEAVLDATAHGLLADPQGVAALLLEMLGDGDA